MVGAYAKGVHHYGEMVASGRCNGHQCTSIAMNVDAFRRMKESVAAHVNPCSACTGVAEAIDPATLTRLSSRPELNGSPATVDTFIQETGRYRVTLSDGETVNVKPRNLVMPAGARVTLLGLGTVRYNGSRGTVRVRVREADAGAGEDEDEEPDGRIDVRLTVERKTVRVELENVLLTRYDQDLV